LSNQIANNIGIGFGSRIREETGSTIEDIAKAYVVCVEVFGLYDTWRKLERMDNVLREQDRYEIFREVSGLLERSISWLLRNQPADFNVSEVIKRYKPDTQALMTVISTAIIGRSRKNYLATRRSFIKYRLPAALAQELVDKTTLASAFDIIEIKTSLGTEIEYVAKLFYVVSERLQLHWIRSAISKTIVRNHWNHLAILNLRNDLHANQHNLTELILQGVADKRQTRRAMALWEEQNAVALERYDEILKEFSAMRTVDFPTISVAVAEVRRLVQINKFEPQLQ
jgi:glutamate dehydrogenase